MATAILGSGKMGEALARGILAAGLLAPAELMLADVDADRLAALGAELGTPTTTDNVVAARASDLIILAVKPQYLAPVARQIAEALAPGSVVLSIAAGITLAQLAGALGRQDLVLARAMPNTPCLIGAGAIGLSVLPGASAETVERVRRLLGATGLVEVVPEAQLNAVTGLSGSGPAYVALLIEALADGGVQAGLPRATAQRLAAQTVLGTARLVLETGQHPGQIKDAVSSPGGTTITGLAALEARGVRGAMMAAVMAATARAQELAKE